MHRITRECDEMTCSCGLRWDVGEEDPHFADTCKKHLKAAADSQRMMAGISVETTQCRVVHVDPLEDRIDEALSSDDKFFYGALRGVTDAEDLIAFVRKHRSLIIEALEDQL